MNAKPPTTSAIVALLRKAGFPRSESTTSSRSDRIGVPHRTEGYEVKKALAPAEGVVVRHLAAYEPGRLPEWPGSRLREYALVIEGAGWKVTRTDSARPYLTVTAGEG